MSTDLETIVRDALKTRGDAITLATLRRTADQHIYRTASILPDTALLPDSETQARRSKRVPAFWLSAAAVLAALVSVVALVANAAHHDEYTVTGGGPSGNGHLLRTLHFAIDLPAGYTITKVASSADGTQDVFMTGPDHSTVWLSVDPPGGAQRRFRDDAQPTTVAGRPGFVGATWTDSQYDTNNRDLPAADLSWRYNDVAYAVLDPGYPAVAASVLTDLAQRIDFSKQTVIRVASSVAALPKGVHFAELISTYREITDTAYPWNSTIVLSLDSSTRDAIRIDVCRCGSSATARSTAQTRTINGRTAYIYSSGGHGGDIEIDEGGGVVLHVSSSHSDDGYWTGTTAQLLSVAAAVRVSSTPDKPTTWFNAATALP